MATLWMTEGQKLGDDGRSTMQVMDTSAGMVHQTPLTITGTSAPSAAFSANMNVVRVTADTTCYLEFGVGTATPTAVTATKIRLVADSVEYFGIAPGQKLAVVA